MRTSTHMKSFLHFKFKLVTLLTCYLLFNLIFSGGEGVGSGGVGGGGGVGGCSGGVGGGGVVQVEFVQVGGFFRWGLFRWRGEVQVGGLSKWGDVFRCGEGVFKWGRDSVGGGWEQKGKRYGV